MRSTGIKNNLKNWYKKAISYLKSAFNKIRLFKKKQAQPKEKLLSESSAEFVKPILNSDLISSYTCIQYVNRTASPNKLQHSSSNFMTRINTGFLRMHRIKNDDNKSRQTTQAYIQEHVIHGHAKTKPLSIK